MGEASIIYAEAYSITFNACKSKCLVLIFHVGAIALSMLVIILFLMSIHLSTLVTLLQIGLLIMLIFCFKKRNEFVGRLITCFFFIDKLNCCAKY